MIKVLNRIEEAVFNALELKFTHLVKDAASEQYFGCSFQLGQLRVKFRMAKITPRKTGQFVALWKRNVQGQTEPFDRNDPFDFYIIGTKQENNFGFFLFPKKILVEKKILTDKLKVGKRGFRIYADWDASKSKQAKQTQDWQSQYFVDLSENLEKGMENIEKYHYSEGPIQLMKGLFLHE